MTRSRRPRVLGGGALVGGVLALLAVFAVPAVAWAAPTTQVVQGEVLRLVSVADWAAASSLRPGAPVQWDVAVSAEAPEPGTVKIAVSATGDAPLRLDIALCPTAWQASGCAGEVTPLRADWSIPRDGSEIGVTEVDAADVARIRLTIVLDGADSGSTTEVRLHAHGAGESAVVGPGGDGLATTGLPPSTPLIFVGGAVLVAAGVLLALRRRRRAGDDGDAEDGGA